MSEFDPNYGITALAIVFTMAGLIFGGLTRGQFFGRNDKA